MNKINCVLFVLLFFTPINVLCDDCYGAGSIVGAVFLTLIVTIGLLCVAFYLWKFYWKSRKGLDKI